MEFTPGDNLLQSINGKKIKCPSKFIPHISDMSDENSGRTLDGVMHQTIVGQVDSIDLGWDLLNSRELMEILQLVCTAKNGTPLSVVYYNIQAGKFVTADLYPGDRTVQAYSSALDMWENLEFTLIRNDAEVF